jgi:hypothetical protein
MRKLRFTRESKEARMRANLVARHKRRIYSLSWTLQLTKQKIVGLSCLMDAAWNVVCAIFERFDDHLKSDTAMSEWNELTKEHDWLVAFSEHIQRAIIHTQDMLVELT